VLYPRRLSSSDFILVYLPFSILAFIGPLNDGRFLPVTVQSVHRNKAPCRVVRASQSASLGLNQEVPGLRNGMVLLSPGSKSSGCLFFQVSFPFLFFIIRRFVHVLMYYTMKAHGGVKVCTSMVSYPCGQLFQACFIPIFLGL
jgi:hypothetical protein